MNLLKHSLSGNLEIVRMKRWVSQAAPGGEAPVIQEAEASKDAVKKTIDTIDATVDKDSKKNEESLAKATAIDKKANEDLDAAVTKATEQLTKLHEKDTTPYDINTNEKFSAYKEAVQALKNQFKEKIKPLQDLHDKLVDDTRKALLKLPNLKTGEKFEGTKEIDATSIEGKKTDEKGNILDGKFDKATGNFIEGTKIFKDGTIASQSGKFEDGALVDGTQIMKDGTTFKGKFEKGIFANGTMTSKEGTQTGKFGGEPFDLVQGASKDLAGKETLKGEPLPKDFVLEPGYESSFGKKAEVAPAQKNEPAEVKDEAPVRKEAGFEDKAEVDLEEHSALGNITPMDGEKSKKVIENTQKMIKGAEKTGNVVGWKGGTDGTPFKPEVFAKKAEWHKKQGESLQKVIDGLGKNIIIKAADGNNDWVKGQIDSIKEYIKTPDDKKGDFAKGIDNKDPGHFPFTAASGIFDIALAYQRAENAALKAGKPIEPGKTPVRLELGSTNDTPAERKGRIWLTEKAAEPAPAKVEPKPEVKPEPKPEVKPEPKPEPKVEPKIEPKPAPTPPPAPIPEAPPEVPKVSPEDLEGAISKDYLLFVKAYQSMFERNGGGNSGREMSVFIEDPDRSIKTPALAIVAKEYKVKFGTERDNSKRVDTYSIKGVPVAGEGIAAERAFLKQMEKDLREYYANQIKEGKLVIKKPEKTPKEKEDLASFEKDFDKRFDARLKEAEAKAGTDLQAKTLGNSVTSGALISVTGDALWGALLDVRKTGTDEKGQPQFEYRVRGGDPIKGGEKKTDGTPMTDREAVAKYMRENAIQQYKLEHNFIVLEKPVVVPKTAPAPEARPTPAPAVEPPKAPAVEPPKAPAVPEAVAELTDAAVNKIADEMSSVGVERTYENLSTAQSLSRLDLPQMFIRKIVAQLGYKMPTDGMTVKSDNIALNPQQSVNQETGACTMKLAYAPADRAVALQDIKSIYKFLLKHNAEKIQ